MLAYERVHPCVFFFISNYSLKSRESFWLLFIRTTVRNVQKKRKQTAPLHPKSNTHVLGQSKRSKQPKPNFSRYVINRTESLLSSIDEIWQRASKKRCNIEHGT